MMVNQDFLEAVRDSNLRMVRIKLGNIIAIDPTLKTFSEMREYAERYMPDLYDEHKGELNWEKSVWSKDYYNDQQAELSFNFSRERLELLCAMAQMLYAERIADINERHIHENKNDTETVQDFIGSLIEGIGEAVENVGKRLRDMGHDLRI
jgi:SpoVK/Ycf46/Vps4 family AAA+-type ATPase